MFRQLYRNPLDNFKSEDKFMRARFIGENSYDAGGPFRDLIENICCEINTRFLKPTSNSDAMAEYSSY